MGVQDTTLHILRAHCYLYTSLWLVNLSCPVHIVLSFTSDCRVGCASVHSNPLAFFPLPLQTEFPWPHDSSLSFSRLDFWRVLSCLDGAPSGLVLLQRDCHGSELEIGFAFGTSWEPRWSRSLKRWEKLREERSVKCCQLFLRGPSGLGMSPTFLSSGTWIPSS